jgi:hypothetical protein
MILVRIGCRENARFLSRCGGIGMTIKGKNDKSGDAHFEFASDWF